MLWFLLVKHFRAIAIHCLLKEVGGAGVMRMEHAENGAEQSGHHWFACHLKKECEWNMSGKTDDGEAGCETLPFALDW
jgi:hypothetical protein